MTAIRLTVGVIVAAGCGPAPLPQALPNEQLATAGTAAATRLTIQLEARLALWRPAAADGPALEVAAFGVVGQPPSVPGPLIRAPVGTEVTVTLANRLADTLLVTGLIDPRSTDTMVIAPGQTGASTFRADRAGLYGYAGHARRGASVDELPRGGQLVGVVAIDSAATGRDRIFAITAWNGPVLPATGDSTFLLAVNGKIWPHTPRIRLGVGDSAHWRVINFARSTHPMHLHGAYFRVDARGDWTGDTAYSLSRRRLAVTEVLRLRETMSISWSPHQPGNWLFHCHDAFHIIHNQLSELPAAAALWSSHLRGDTVHAQALPPVHSEEGHGMAGLVLGIEVSGPTPTRSSLTERRIDLTIQQRARVFGESEGIGAVLARPGQLPADSIQIPSAPLIAWRGQPTAVMVHNRLPAATSIHWHGLELESYFDGVAGFSGQRGRLAPEIAPGDSFMARFTPPRAGTFIYHSHFSEVRQLSLGLFGPLLVLEPGTRWDPDHDRVVIFSVAGLGDSALVVAHDSLAPLRRGRRYRFRFINITPADDVVLETLQAGQPVDWLVVAKDGADLPAGRPGPARLRFGPGETTDIELVVGTGPLAFRVKSFNDFDTAIPVR